MIIHNCEQRSGVWHALRSGKVTASNAHRLLTKAKFQAYFYELVHETITGELTEHYLSAAMQWGIDQEPFAMEWYAENVTQDVYTVGFIEVEGLIAGCSPDLLVGHDGLVQIKCPQKNHVAHIIEGPDKDYITQMQFEMFVTGRQWNDFLSYEPRWPENVRGHVIRIERDEEIIQELEAKTREMESLIDAFMIERNIVLRKMEIEKQEIDKSLYLRV